MRAPPPSALAEAELISESWAMVLTNGPIVMAPHVPALRNCLREIFFRILDMALFFDLVFRGKGEEVEDGFELIDTVLIIIIAIVGIAVGTVN